MRVISTLFWVTLLGTLGWTLANTNQSPQCASEQNTNVLERAFGLVMKTKLEAQSLAIQTKMDLQTSDLKEDSKEQTMKIQEKIDSQTSEIKDHVDSQIRGIQDHLDFQVELSAQTSEIKGTLEMQASQIARVEQNQAKIETQMKEIQANMDSKTNTILEQMQEFFMEQKKWETKRALNLANFDVTEPEWVQDSLIWFSNQAANFDQAQANCQSMGGKLFEPQTLHENNQVYELMEAKGRTLNWHWIGINDKAQEGTYVYASTGNPIAFQHWGTWSSSGQLPNSVTGGNEKCAGFVSSTTSAWNGPNNSWRTKKCFYGARWICEKRLV